MMLGGSGERWMMECNVVYAHWERIDATVSGVDLFEALFGSHRASFWLDSAGGGDAQSANWSYMGGGDGPHAVVLSYHRSDQAVVETWGARQRRTGIANWFDYLGSLSTPRVDSPPPIPFSGGWVGWFGYELGAECGYPVAHEGPLPDGYLMAPDRYIAIDHGEQQVYVVALSPESGDRVALGWVADTLRQIRGLGGCKGSPPRTYPLPSALTVALGCGYEGYVDRIQSCLDWIGKGDSYQLCLTNEWVCEVSVDGWVLYQWMRRQNPAPYSAYIQWEGGRILCSSPELLIQIDGDGTVTSKPIKGTTHRSLDQEEDARLKAVLRASEKNKAENVMIIDLIRNDLSRVCEVGSVRVPAPLAIETYATVHQLVSTITGRLRGGIGAIEVVRAMFPGGSITGAPKYRSIELLSGIEGRARGIYTGSIGWMGWNQMAQLNIVIRSVIQAGDWLVMGVGGGIVSGSNPDEEFDEIKLKGKGAIDALVGGYFGQRNTGSISLKGDRGE